MDEYSLPSKGKLKLKNDSEFKKKKKKKHNKEKDVLQKSTIESNERKDEGRTEIKFTKAELAFKQQQEKMRNKKIMEKASATHKERVEKFNEHLDSLTEHFDIPKVSWTK